MWRRVATKLGAVSSTGNVSTMSGQLCRASTSHRNTTKRERDRPHQRLVTETYPMVLRGHFPSARGGC